MGISADFPPVAVITDEYEPHMLTFHFSTTGTGTMQCLAQDHARLGILLTIASQRDLNGET